jgi:hypothetical protein
MILCLAYINRILFAVCTSEVPVGPFYFSSTQLHLYKSILWAVLCKHHANCAKNKSTEIKVYCSLSQTEKRNSHSVGKHFHSLPAAPQPFPCSPPPRVSPMRHFRCTTCSHSASFPVHHMSVQCVISGVPRVRTVRHFLCTTCSHRVRHFRCTMCLHKCGHFRCSTCPHSASFPVYHVSAQCAISGVPPVRKSALFPGYHVSAQCVISCVTRVRTVRHFRCTTCPHSAPFFPVYHVSAQLRPFPVYHMFAECVISGVPRVRKSASLPVYRVRKSASFPVYHVSAHVRHFRCTTCPHCASFPVYHVSAHVRHFRCTTGPHCASFPVYHVSEKSAPFFSGVPCATLCCALDGGASNRQSRSR